MESQGKGIKAANKVAKASLKPAVCLLALLGAATAGDKLNINDRFLNPHVIYRGANPALYSTQRPFKMQKSYEIDEGGNLSTWFGGLMVTNQETLGGMDHNVDALIREFDERYLSDVRAKYHKMLGKAEKLAKSILTELRDGINRIVEDENA